MLQRLEDVISHSFREPFYKAFHPELHKYVRGYRAVDHLSNHRVHSSHTINTIKPTAFWLFHFTTEANADTHCLVSSK